MIVNIWQDIDRVAFFENSIILEMKSKSQGECVKFDKSNLQNFCSPGTSRRYHYPVRDFLDDVCLVASGCGGADNVTAACLELVDCEGPVLVLRLARNAGASPQMLKAIRDILDEASQVYKSGLFIDPYRHSNTSAYDGRSARRRGSTPCSRSYRDSLQA